jgi:hypothetical protein
LKGAKQEKDEETLCNLPSVLEEVSQHQSTGDTSLVPNTSQHLLKFLPGIIGVSDYHEKFAVMVISAMDNNEMKMMMCSSTEEH